MGLSRNAKIAVGVAVAAAGIGVVLHLAKVPPFGQQDSHGPYGPTNSPGGNYGGPGPTLNPGAVAPPPKATRGFYPG